MAVAGVMPLSRVPSWLESMSLSVCEIGPPTLIA
jgi:hypothetical protein